jgi:hypothetical protein
MSDKVDITTDYLTREGYRVIHAGDDYDYTFTVLRDGSALSLVGAKLWFTIKARSSDLDPGKLQYDSTDSTEMEITDGANGIFVLHLKAADTKDLEGTWEYDIKALLSSGSIIRLSRGVIEFLPNITRASS